VSDPRTYLLSLGALRIRLSFESDRYAHSIELADGERWITMLRTREGSPDEAWPASPPFQSVHLDISDPDKHVALLVGMAGRSHWSASVELDGTASRATFDVACRLPAGQSGTLASTYDTSFPAEACDERHTWLLLPHDRSRGLSLAIDDRHAVRLAAARDRLAVQVDDPSPSAARTVRWRYTIEAHHESPISPADDKSP
jgi:hypothetical protein